MIKRVLGWLLRRKPPSAPVRTHDGRLPKPKLRLVYGGLHLCDVYNLKPTDHAILDALLREEGKLSDPFARASAQWALDVERQQHRRDT